MILDKLCQATLYEGMHPQFQEAFEFLKTAADKPCGRYELSGGMYVSISEVSTHPAGEALLEAHRRYIDIQYLFAGHSSFGWAHTPDLAVEKPYDEQADVEFFKGERVAVPVQAGEFYILYPTDAHEPHQTCGEPAAYRVAVVKVPV